jgi:hypothetical protein
VKKGYGLDDDFQPEVKTYTEAMETSGKRTIGIKSPRTQIKTIYSETNFDYNLNGRFISI